MIRARNGFVTVLFLSLLPVVLSGGLALFAVFGFLKADLALLNVCRARELEVQSKVGRSLGKLLKLNPRAENLRFAQARAEHTLMVALSSGAAPVIATAEARLLRVKMQRQSLDLRQRALIDGANAALAGAGRSLPSELTREWRFQVGPLNSWLRGGLEFGAGDVPRLAVHADIPEVGPLYQPTPRFEDDQAWKQSWKLHFEMIEGAQRILPWHGSFERSCTSSLYLEGDEWKAEMKKDKSLLKGLWR